MWNNFYSVVEDLFIFAVDAVCGLGGKNNDSHSRTLQLPATQEAPIAHTVSKAEEAVVASNSKPLPLQVPRIKSESKISNTHEILHEPKFMYVSNPEGALCFNLPQQDFDCVIDTLAYGTALTVIGYSGQYASVNRSNITGWVRKDDLAINRYEVWPSFTVGTQYDAENIDTIKTRHVISDMFYGANLGLPLQAGEYIMVKLLSENRGIPWPYKRPRLAGAWQKLLRGVSGIHIGISPKTDSIMEWTTEDGEGRLAYVESVSPDKTLIVSAVGYDAVGQYVSKTLAEDVWKELRPVFIEVV